MYLFYHYVVTADAYHRSRPNRSAWSSISPYAGLNVFVVPSASSLATKAGFGCVSVVPPNDVYQDCTVNNKVF
jgi:hypothetical protein